jgi:hypothetical protein
VGGRAGEWRERLLGNRGYIYEGKVLQANNIIHIFINLVIVPRNDERAAAPR